MVAKKKSGIEHTKTTSSVFLPYSSFAVILSVFLMLSSFTTDIAFSIPNRYNIPLVVNHPPVVKAGPDQTVEENGTVVLHGIANDSDPGDIISYSWRQMAGHAVKLSSSNSKNPSFIAPKVSVDTQLRFALTARDDRGATSITPANVTITVKHINRALVANAGTDQTVNAGYVVTLDGSKSRDQDNDPLTYTWKETEGTPVVLNGANTSIATFTAPKGISSDTDMTFELTVTDSKNATNTSTVKVTAKYVPPPNQPPIANAGLDQTVNAGDKVILYGSGSKDPDGTIISYSWKQSSGPSVALNSSDRGGKTFSAPPVLSVTTLAFSLTVTDDKGASSTPENVAITVKPHEPIGIGGNKTSKPVCQYVPGPRHSSNLISSCNMILSIRYTSSTRLSSPSTSINSSLLAPAIPKII